MLALTAARLVTPVDAVEDPVVLLDGGKIVQVASQRDRELSPGIRVVDFGDALLAPGFMDIHIHGSGGHDVMEGTREALSAVSTFLYRHGVTSYFPTTVTAPEDATLFSLERLADQIERAERGEREEKEAQPLGIHLEGPFISHARRGVHPPEYLLRPSLQVFERLWQAARGHIKVLTMAPELEDAGPLIQEASRLGVCVSLGHSDADSYTTRRAIDAGARHATHTFNAMRALNHREPGILGEVLTNERVTADIIADGIHLDPKIAKLFFEAKGADAAVLITDAISATGMPDGHYRLGSFEVEVKGARCLADGRLAGSVLTMDRAVRHAMEFTGWELQTALRAATANPARVMGLEKRKGVIAAGADADLVALTAEGEVRQTIVGGVVE